MVKQTMRRAWWLVALSLCAACPAEGGDDAGSEGGDGCDCMLGAYVPACGVDGMTYDATCGLECVSAEILCMGECPCPEIACGDALACGPTDPVCTTTIPGRQGSDTTYACGPVPEACAGVVPPTCACVAEAEPGCTCMEDPVGYFQVTCALP